MNAINETSFVPLQWPSEDGCRVPYRVFTDPRIYATEQDLLFRGPTWSYLGLEAELPNPGDFKATYMGDTPVVVNRDADGELRVFVNRCAHRGALICRVPRGKVDTHTCVYHQWAYDLKGNLVGVPFRKGLNGKGGMPEEFDMAEHGLEMLRVESYAGLVFATFDQGLESVVDFLGPMVTGAIDRIFNRPIKILGDQRQYIAGNWKLYEENTRDPYHASLLHLFHTTFGLYRSSQKGGSVLDSRHIHSMLTASQGTDEGKTDAYKDLRTYDTSYKLNDPSLLKGRKEFADGVTLMILAIFPNLVLQQISNTLATRQILPKGVDRFELVWTQFGYVDDDEEMDEIRIKQGNLIGPAGLVSMEDGEAVQIVQDAIIRDQDRSSYIAMGGMQAGDSDHLVTEAALIGFWNSYRERMGFARAG